jgi:hypothetical protein
MVNDRERGRELASKMEQVGKSREELCARFAKMELEHSAFLA